MYIGRVSKNGIRPEMATITLSHVLMSSGPAGRTTLQICQSQTPENESNRDESDMTHMEAMLDGFEDFIIHCPIAVEEIESALNITENKKEWGS